ncbi:MAG: metabolite traffic protein EboE [Kiritimatiellae bacterium]|nr:metabolite traffic protein EboE [Kiritimatiellia bacterium]
MSKKFLTYCMNVHKGEGIGDVMQAITDFAAPIGKEFSLFGERFGVGLRLAAKAVDELTTNPFLLQALLQLMRSNRLFAFTMNAFPFGTFHGVQVKDEVYRPAWDMEERLEYTKRSANILAQLLPDNVEYGSISTSPANFKAWNEPHAKAIENYIAAAKHLQGVEEKYGKRIVLCIEAEPGCYPETTPELIDFFKQLREAGLTPELERYLGVCFDTAHQSVEFENLAEAVRELTSNGIFIGKVQLSAAMVLPDTAEGKAILAQYNESTYLHQTVQRTADGAINRADDIPQALEFASQEGAELRVHFHVPLYITPTGLLGSTAEELKSAAFAEALAASGCQHFECETYTWEVWNSCSGAAIDIKEGLLGELRWARENCFSKVIENE